MTKYPIFFHHLLSFYRECLFYDTGTVAALVRGGTLLENKVNSMKNSAFENMHFYDQSSMRKLLPTDDFYKSLGGF